MHKRFSNIWANFEREETSKYFSNLVTLCLFEKTKIKDQSRRIPLRKHHKLVSYQEFLSVVRVRGAGDEGGGRHRRGFNHLRGQEDGHRAEKLKLVLLKIVKKKKRLIKRLQLYLYFTIIAVNLY